MNSSARILDFGHPFGRSWIGLYMPCQDFYSRVYK